MASTISAGTSAGTAIAITGDTTGNLAFTTQAGANTITVPNSTGTVALTSALPASSQLCKAWVNWNGSTAAIRDSYNVSSVTRSATGNYLVNFTTAMTNANYAVAVSVSSMPAVSDANLISLDNTSGSRTAPTTTALAVSTFNAQFNYLDITYIRLVVFSS
jgi:hypothetical protein